MYEKDCLKIEELLLLDEIPTNHANIRTILKYLHSQNWGVWRLPKLSISYSAHQYDCDGSIASTITLDKPIDIPEFGLTNIRKFKIGGKRGHLTKFTHV